MDLDEGAYCLPFTSMKSREEGIWVNQLPTTSYPGHQLDLMRDAYRAKTPLSVVCLLKGEETLMRLKLSEE